MSEKERPPLSRDEGSVTPERTTKEDPSRPASLSPGGRDADQATTTTEAVPRRIHLDLFIPAETAIWEAALAVDALPAHPRLTDALVLLAQAREAVADYVDGSAPDSSQRSKQVNGQERSAKQNQRADSSSSFRDQVIRDGAMASKDAYQARLPALDLGYLAAARCALTQALKKMQDELPTEGYRLDGDPERILDELIAALTGPA